jgi:hypothetical protein
VPSRDTTRIRVASPAPLTWIVAFRVLMAASLTHLAWARSGSGSWVPPGARTQASIGLRPERRIGRPTYSLI